MSAPPNIIVRLPQELRHLVLSFCDSSTVLNLCLTSKATYNVCIHSLFHTVDLSFHNDDRWGTHRDYINVTVPPDHIDLSLQDHQRYVTGRQRKLMELLNGNLELGLQARVLRWTLVDTDCNPNSHHPRDSRDGFNHGTYDLWGTFMCFTKIAKIDISFQTGYRELDPPPSSMFSTATSISLGGMVSHAVLSRILNSVELSKLRHLRLNNLQTIAEPDSVLETLSNNEIEVHRRDRTGVAQGYLAQLTGRCTNLRSFHFLTTAAFVDKSLDRIVDPPWIEQVADEHRRYSEIGAFISSVKPTLHEFIFEHGPDIDYYDKSPGRHTCRAFAGPIHDNPLPMDTYFDNHILPVLALGPWPKLDRIIVRGVGHWKPLNAWRENSTPEEIRWLHRKTREFRDRAVMIWDAVGDGCEIVVEDEASRPFYSY